MKPLKEEYPAYYGTYIDKVEEGNIATLMVKNFEETMKVLQTIPEEKSDFRYADGKWSIKEVVLHMADTERVMSYRALRISRGDQTPIPGFEQDDYVANASLEHRSLKDIVAEWNAIRAASIMQFKYLNDEELMKSGIANGQSITTRALGFIILGHELHHMGILAERYLQ